MRDTAGEQRSDVLSLNPTYGRANIVALDTKIIK